jgi:hypothetical protein
MWKNAPTPVRKGVGFPDSFMRLIEARAYVPAGCATAVRVSWDNVLKKACARALKMDEDQVRGSKPFK